MYSVLFFCLDAKERYQKKKNQGCTCGATPAVSPAKGQELAPLKQPALLDAGDTASA
ncbi:hypothetical protein NXW26_17100 [Bacteroides faecis]|nr:hypothetical protein [Bacteroides faecis]UVR63288.1 hypothetical protein NXW26_17100 [Bacteroides faecis]